MDRPGQPATPRLATAIRRDAPELVEEATAAILAIDGYRRLAEPQLEHDVRAHVEAHVEASVSAFVSGEPVAREHVASIRGFASRRVAQGLSIADFVHAFEAADRIVLTRAFDLADGAHDRTEVTAFVLGMREYWYLATVEAADAYLEAEALRAASAEGVRRDAVEDLVAGRVPAPGPTLDAVRDAGLGDDVTCLVLSAAVLERTGVHTLREAAAALARATGAALQPLVVVRRQDVVAVLPVEPAGTTALVERIAGSQRRLRESGRPLAIGVSTLHTGLGGLDAAYREAASARDRLAGVAGLVALCEMRSFDYLTWRADPTARRLVRPAVERFVVQDRAAGGDLVHTLEAYYAADLNAKQAAVELHMHVNTVYYRLGKIADATGCNLRRVADVVELRIAARLLS